MKGKILLVLMLVGRALQPVWAQTPAVANDLEFAMMACSPEKSTVQNDGTIVLRAWGSPRFGKTAQFSWVVNGGLISGHGNEADWNLRGVSAGIYKATVSIKNESEIIGDCTISIGVFEQERGSPETGRAFLLKGRKEAEGYGLYSYLLIGAHPTDTSHDRLLRVVEAYLKTIENVSALEDGYFRRAQLNITYLPLNTPPKQSADAAWLLGHYDYDRARLLLDSLPGDRRDGVYIVSCLKPLSTGANPPYLLQDLSIVPASPPDLMSWWMREFVNQAAQEHFWDPKTSQLLLLKMRTTIAVLANGFPEVEHSVKGLIKSLQ